MSLSDLASLGSFVSGFAVLVSLIYLSLQVRQATKHSRALISQARTTRIVDMIFRDSDTVASTLRSKARMSPNELNEAEMEQYMGIEITRFFNAEDTFIQQHMGLLDDTAYSTFNLNQRYFMQSPGYRAAWKLVRHRFDPGFAAFMDEVARDGAQKPTPDTLSEWRRLIAAEQAAAS